MTQPKTFNVADVHYRIVEKEFVEISGNRNYQGLCDYQTTTIEVLEELPFDRKNEVLIHELLHAIFNEAGYDEQDEEEITRVGRVLYQVLKNNDFSFLKEKTTVSANPFQHHPLEGSISVRNTDMVNLSGVTEKPLLENSVVIKDLNEL